MKTILSPVDFSKNAVNAAEYAVALGERFGSTVFLLHVFETPVVFSEMNFTNIGNIKAAIRETAEKKMSTLQKKLSNKYKNTIIKTMLAEGSASKEIPACAAQLGAEMIVMGTTGTSKMERLLMGSTTASVIQHATCPVLCIPKQTEYHQIEKIVFATDLHEDNIAVASSLAALAKKFDAEIIFVFVDDKHLVHTEEAVSGMTKKIRSRVKYPKISGYISKNTSVTKGLEYFLKKYPADMLAMYTHEKHFPQSLFNQSMTKIMSHQTSIPLLALKISDRTIL